MTAFTTRQQVRFGHVDPAGIAYFPRIFDYIHEAFEDLWDRHVGQLYYHILTRERIGFPLVHSEVSFRKMLNFGDRPLVRVTCFKLGRSSLGLRYVYETDGEVCVDARMVTTCVKLDTLETIPLPDAWRPRFEEIMEAP